MAVPVVPLAGTWIEIGGTWDMRVAITVVPLAGTWIEIDRNLHRV